MFVMTTDLNIKSIITHFVIKILSKIVPEAQVISELTYTDTIRYFVNHRPNDDRIVKGSILIQPNKKGNMTIWAFLDENNDVVCNNEGTPYGRKLIARSLDKELKEAFGTSNLLIIE